MVGLRREKGVLERISDSHRWMVLGGEEKGGGVVC